MDIESHTITPTPRSQEGQPESRKMHVSRASRLPSWAIAFPLFYLLSLLLYWPTLKCFFVFDDLSHIMKTAPCVGMTWMECLKPLSNGCWRPANLFLFRLLLVLFGLHPLFFHIACLAIHALAATATLLLAQRLQPRSNRLPWLIGLWTCMNIGGYNACMMLSSSCDSLVSVGFLIGLIFWDEWVAKRVPIYYALSFAACLFSLASKEVGVVFPILLLLWLCIQRNLTRRDWKALAPFFILGIVSTAIFAYLQISSRLSYMQAGQIHIPPSAWIRQLMDYLFSAVFPFVHVVDFPLGRIQLHHSGLWVIRLAILSSIAVAALRPILAGRPLPKYLLLLACAAAVLVIPSAITGAPQSRYLYPALPFAGLALGQLIVESETKRWARRAFTAYAAMFCVLSFVAVYRSPTICFYRRTANEVEAFVRAAKTESSHWKNGDIIGVANHPHPGNETDRWIYAQSLFKIFIPQVEVTICFDPSQGFCNHRYRYVHGSLDAIR